MDIRDGGPAFPQGPDTGFNTPGMTLREYFAAHAPELPYGLSARPSYAEQLAKWAWDYADEMIKKRRKVMEDNSRG